MPSGSRHLPVQSGNRPEPTFEAVAKPVRAGEAEIAANPRARSATLRVARRTAASAWTSREGMPSMIARGFKPVVWVAAVGGAALGCYMLSLQVAAERAELAKVERQIVAAKREIRSLQTELGTRGRLPQLEQWNADVLALSAPALGQFLKDEFTLARLRPQRADASRTERPRCASRPPKRAGPSRAEARQAGGPCGRPGRRGPPGRPAADDPPRRASRPPRPPPSRSRRSNRSARLKPTARSEAQRTASAAAAKPDRDRSKPAVKPAKPARATHRLGATGEIR